MFSGRIVNSDWDDYRWLATDEGRAALNDLAGVQGPLTTQVPRLRKKYPAQITHRLVEQVELQKRAAQKFTNPEAMLFTPIGLEQATDQWVAAYKATRFQENALERSGAIADLCCGIGGDLLMFARQRSAIGVDRDPCMAWLARHNTGAETVACDAAQFDVRDVAAWHIDPDRRPDGRRTTRAIDHQPGVEILEQFLSTNGNGAIKLAPAAEWPGDWNQHAEFEWISRGGECRQLVVWSGALARFRGQRVATVLDRRGAVLETICGPHEPIECAGGDLGAWLFEPDPVVIAAGLTGALAQSQGLRQPTPGIAYLTGDKSSKTLAVSAFEVLEVMPMDLKRLRTWLRDRDAQCIEVKKRGVEIDPALILQQLRLTGSQNVSLLVFPRAGRITAVFARRVTGAAS